MKEREGRERRKMRDRDKESVCLVKVTCRKER